MVLTPSTALIICHYFPRILKFSLTPYPPHLKSAKVSLSHEIKELVRPS